MTPVTVIMGLCRVIDLSSILYGLRTAWARHIRPEVVGVPRWRCVLQGTVAA